MKVDALTKPGDILVVTPMSAYGDDFFGDLLATSLIAHGVKSAILDTGVRDVSVITEMNFRSYQNALVHIANALIRPGDVIVANIDGVVVVRRERAAEILEKKGLTYIDHEESS